MVEEGIKEIENMRIPCAIVGPKMDPCTKECEWL